MSGLAHLLIRLLALVGKELVELVRRPGALITLIFGPFLIMALFGVGYDGARRPFETILIVPPSSELPSEVSQYQDLAGPALHIVSIETNRAVAEVELAAGRIDLVVVAPEHPAEAFERGEQSVFDVLINAVDPVEVGYAGFLADSLSSAVNREIIRQAADEGKGIAGDFGLLDTGDTPLAILAEPTRAEVRNIAAVAPGVTAFFGPAILALILQHLAVTLVALSLVRERTTGIIEMYRVAPVNAWEVLAGKLLAYAFVGSLIAAATVALLHLGFGVPVLGDPRLLAVSILLLLLASLGLGLAIAVISDSERQAVQLSMLVLLASVFFSGFVLSIEEFNEPVRSLAFALPVTSGISLVQEVMLRGGAPRPEQFAVLGIIALVTLTVSWFILRRGMSQA